MALVIFINIPIAVIAIILAFITFHFSEESEVKSSSLDVKGLFFYIFIGLFMFGLLSKSSIVLNIIALMLAFILSLFYLNLRAK